MGDTNGMGIVERYFGLLYQVQVLVLVSLSSSHLETKPNRLGFQMALANNTSIGINIAGSQLEILVFV